MSLRPAHLRQRIAAQLTAVAGASGFRESPQAYDAFPGRRGDDQVVAELEFAVGLRGSAAQPGRQRRTGDGAGVLTITEVRVRFTSAIQPDGQVEALDEALEREQLLVDAVLATPKNPDFTVRFVGIEARAIPIPGLFVGELRFEALHVYPLGS